MPFSIQTTLNIASGIVLPSAVNKSITLSEENVHQVNLTIAGGAVDEEVFLDITDFSKVKSMFLTTSSPITYNFSAGAGDDYPLNSSVMLVGGSAEAFQKLIELTGGTLVVDQQYFIKTYMSGDSFTNVGAASDTEGIGFYATGDTPADWTNGSTLLTRDKSLPSIFISNPGGSGTTATFNAVLVISND